MRFLKCLIRKKDFIVEVGNSDAFTDTFNSMAEKIQRLFYLFARRNICQDAAESGGTVPVTDGFNRASYPAGLA